MVVRGCPFECTFCIHNYTRKATEGLGTTCAGAASTTSWPSCARPSRSGRSSQPSPSATTSSRPPRPWLEEFCARYKAEIGLPFVICTRSRAWSTSGAVALMRDAGLWVDDHGHPVGLGAHPPRLLRARDLERGDHRGLRDPGAPRRRAEPRLHRRQSLRDRRRSRARRWTCSAACRSRSTSTTSR